MAPLMHTTGRPVGCAGTYLLAMYGLLDLFALIFKCDFLSAEALASCFQTHHLYSGTLNLYNSAI